VFILQPVLHIRDIDMKIRELNVVTHMPLHPGRTQPQHQRYRPSSSLSNLLSYPPNFALIKVSNKFQSSAHIGLNLNKYYCTDVKIFISVDCKIKFNCDKLQNVVRPSTDNKNDV